MTTRSFCNGCDRDISNDDNMLCICLEASINAMMQGKTPLPGKRLDYCLTCAKQLLTADVWNDITACATD